VYHFAIVALLGLATLKVIDLIEDFVPAVTRVHALVTFALAIVAALVIDYSMFDGFGVGLRERDYGVWLTGITIGSMATVWRVAFGWLGSDEGARPEERHQVGPRRVAA
jgi:hypothetical protein